MWNEQRMLTMKKFYQNNLKENSLDVSKSTLDDRLKDGTLDLLYKINKSITQSYRSCAGKVFENCIEHAFDKYGVNYSKQVLVDTNGIVHNKKTKVLANPRSKFHYLDFVIPHVQQGESIYSGKYQVISVKTTLRERYLQDVSPNMTTNLVLISLEQIQCDGILSIKVCEKEKQLTNFMLDIIKQQSTA